MTIKNKIFSTNEYLMRFFDNLLLGENNELKNRDLRIEAISEVVEEQKLALNLNLGGQKIDSGGQKKWSEKVVRLLELIAGKPGITRKELSEKLKINPSAVQKHIDKLKNEGVISREGSDKKGVWKVITKGDSNE